jgi:RND family efflux transporter MFP subunit
MSLKKPVAIISVAILMMCGVAALAQNGRPSQAAGGAVEALVVDQDPLPTIDWIDFSKVAALREGVVEKMEYQLGMPVKKGSAIGYLHKKIAELTVRKSKLQADSTAPTEKAKAQKDVAISVVARNVRLNERKPGMVSAEDVAKAEGELKVAEAQLHEAEENVGIAGAELALAVQTLEEHTVRAPFDGMITKLLKHPGEKVSASEAVVEMGNLSRLCANGWVPLEYAYRVKEGQVVELQPRLTNGRGEPLPIEKKKFRGKITFVDPQIQAVAETAVRIRAEFDNPDLELKPGLKAQLTIYLTPVTAAATPDRNSTTRTAQSR